MKEGSGDYARKMERRRIRREMEEQREAAILERLEELEAYERDAEGGVTCFSMQ